MGATLGTEEGSIYQPFCSTTQLFQELLFKLVLLQFSKKIQSISSKFQNCWKNFNPSDVKISPIKSKNVYTFKEFFFQNCVSCKFGRYFLSSKSSKSLGNLKSFSEVKSQKVGFKCQNTFPKCQRFLKVTVFSFCNHIFIFGRAKV